MFIIKKTGNNECWRGCWEKGTLVHCWWECNVNWYYHYAKQCEDFSNIKARITIWSSFSTSGCLSKEYENTNLKRLRHPYFQCNIICNSQDLEITSIYQRIEWIKKMWLLCMHAHTHTVILEDFYKLQPVQICPKADLQNLLAGGILKYQSPSPRPMFPNSPVDGKYVRTIGLILSGRHAARLSFFFGVSDLGPVCLSIHPSMFM